ncbi:acid protease [Rickenella mellea]|uniref:Acid protease n=1 Tax=Rickenella mellea TaxID=50990 RepID=A0A4Y7QJL2_9AGAM|nr:acid protease [Rickenella mellea]
MASFTSPIFRTPKGRVHPTPTGHANEAQLTDAGEYSYLITVGFGGQDFQVVLDTGSSDLWIVSSDCQIDDCSGIEKYNSTSTLSLSPLPFSLSYLTGSVSGVVAFETVSFGPFQISSQVFALVNQTKDLGMSSTGDSGILGLSFPTIASIPGSDGRTLLENIYSHLDPSDCFFAFKLGRDEVTNPGTFSVGELDLSITPRSSEILYSPVYSSDGSRYDYWKLPLLAITVSSKVIPFIQPISKVSGSSSPIAVLDTGTTFVLGPTRDVDNLWAAAGGARKTSDNTWQVRCDHAVTVGFVLGNDTAHKEFVLDPSDVSWSSGPTSDGWCLGGIQANDGVFSGDWLMGDAFLRNVYVTHHAASPSSPPLIGLLSITDPAMAMTQFLAQRGADNTPTNMTTPMNLLVHSSQSGDTALFGVALLLGFLGSSVVTVLLRLRGGRKNRNTYT